MEKMGSGVCVYNQLFSHGEWFAAGFLQSSAGYSLGGPIVSLFVFIGEALSKMFTLAFGVNLISGFRRVYGGPTVTHLQFVDDTIIFYEANEEEVRIVKAIMLCFDAISRLKVIFLKSELIGVGLEEERVMLLADIMGCKVGLLTVTYLGLPLCVENSSKALWNSVLERVERRLAIWKEKYLSVGGRVTLIQAVFSNLPIYFMFLFKCSMSVVKKVGEVVEGLSLAG